MPRVKRGVTARAKHKKILAEAKGYTMAAAAPQTRTGPDDGRTRPAALLTSVDFPAPLPPAMPTTTGFLAASVARMRQAWVPPRIRSRNPEGTLRQQ